MRVKFATWNVNYRKFKPSHAAFIEKVDADFLALQEVSAQFHLALKDSGIFGWSESSMVVFPSQAGAPKARLLGCSIFGKDRYPSTSAIVLPHLAFPERTLIVEVQLPVGHLTLCSFHIPPGASWKLIKPQTMCSIADYLATLGGRVIVGMDANAPKVDHPDHSQNVWWWKDEPRLLGHNADHHLQDAFREYLKDNPQQQKEISADRKNGPLAVSHRRGCGPVRTDCRYDFVLITPGIKVLSIDYLYAESVAAGSDHALVVAELELSEAKGSATTPCP